MQIVIPQKYYWKKNACSVESVVDRRAITGMNSFVCHALTETKHPHWKMPSAPANFVCRLDFCENVIKLLAVTSSSGLDPSLLLCVNEH